MKLPIDEQGWRDKGMGFTKSGQLYRFILPGRSDVCEARIRDDSIEIFPERSAAHKALLAAVG